MNLTWLCILVASDQEAMPQVGGLAPNRASGAATPQSFCWGVVQHSKLQALGRTATSTPSGVGVTWFLNFAGARDPKVLRYWGMNHN